MNAKCVICEDEITRGVEVQGGYICEDCAFEITYGSLVQIEPEPEEKQ